MKDHRTDDNVDAVGKGVGGVAGAATGATLGSLAGPLGTVVGGIAGAIGGWWSGKAVADAAQTAQADDDYYQQRFSSASSGRDYDTARPAYHLGHVAGMNPEYAGRSFDEVEPHLQHGWTNDVSASSGDWNDVRGYARDAYDRGQNQRLTLSEEQLDVGTREVAAGEVSLRKHVDTNQVEQEQEGGVGHRDRAR